MEKIFKQKRQVAFRNPMPPVTIPKDDDRTENAVKFLVEYASRYNMSWQQIVRDAIVMFANYCKDAEILDGTRNGNQQTE